MNGYTISVAEGSSICGVYTFKESSVGSSIINRILGIPIPHTPAIVHGHTFEPIARKLYYLQCKRHHEGLQIE